MRKEKISLRKWIDGSVFGIWAAALAYLLFTRRYTDFLRPEFGILLALALLISIGFLYTIITEPDRLKIDIHSLFRALVILMPLFFLSVLPNNTLGGNAFKKRFTGTTGINDESKQKVSSPAFKKTSEAAQKPSYQQTILDLYRKPEHFEGRRVVFSGMIMRNKELKSYFGGETAVYRFLITCCAADAMPLAISIPSDLSKNYPEDKWVEVDGKFELRKIDGKLVPYIEKPTLKSINAPKVPYLF